MKPMLLTTYLKWGHKKNRQLLTASLVTAMIASVAIQGWEIYGVVNKPQALSQPEATTTVTTQPLKQGDFKFLFGVNERPEAKSGQADIPKTRLSLVLRGALSGLDNKEYASAIIQGSNQDKLYEIGDSLPGGVTLTKVFSDHVVLSRGGQLETLYFPDSGKDARALQEYKAPETTKSGGNVRGDYNDSSDGKSLEQRMQDLREKLQEANQGN